MNSNFLSGFYSPLQLKEVHFMFHLTRTVIISINSESLLLPLVIRIQSLTQTLLGTTTCSVNEHQMKRIHFGLVLMYNFSLISRVLPLL